MNTIIKKPYEISIWDDFQDNGVYREKKIAIIGSNTMDTPIRAQEPQLISNINGTNKLIFSIYYKYYDVKTGEMVDNPFVKYLVNERKIKLKYDEKWYDFIIKSIQENSSDYKFTYTCQDLFINELSKNGYIVELSNKLQNNQGTVQTLAKKVLEGTDWKVEEGDIIQQKNEEPLYKIILKNNIILSYREDNGQIDQLEVVSGNTIYGYYSQIISKDKRVQFIYREDGKYEIDSERIILNNPQNYYIENVRYDENGLPTFASTMDISSEYRGERLVRSQLSTFDPITNRYVNIYEKNGRTLYGYSTIEAITPETVPNLITNSKDFVDTSGWTVAHHANSYVNYFTYPDISTLTQEQIENGEINSYLDVHLGWTNTESQKYSRLLNSGLYSNFQYLGDDGLSHGEKYVLRLAYGQKGTDNSGKPSPLDSLLGKYPLRAIITGYINDENGYITNPQPRIMTFHLEKEGVNNKYGGLSYYRSIEEFDLNKVVDEFRWYYQNPEISKEELITGRDIIWDFNTLCLITESEYNLLLQGILPNSFTNQNDPYYKGNLYSSKGVNFNNLGKEGIKNYTNKNIRHTTERFGIVFEIDLDEDDDFNKFRAVKNYLIADCQLFPFVARDGTEEPIYPDEITGVDYSVTNYFYESTNPDDFIDKTPSKNANATSSDEIVPEYNGVGIPDNIVPIYDETCEKIRSIEISESNYFNIIQTLAETFECWAKFEIQHESTGEISLTEPTTEMVEVNIFPNDLDWSTISAEKQVDNNEPIYVGNNGIININIQYYQVTQNSNNKYVYTPINPFSVNEELTYYTKNSSGEYVVIDILTKNFLVSTPIFIKKEIPGHQIKIISFQEYIGKDNYVGFKYGINLNTIQRTLVSDQVVSKIIVKPNTNEFAQNGYCTISRSQYNPTKESFLLNFDYYINQGLLDLGEVTNDFYTTGSPLYIGYYGKLNALGARLEQINEKREPIISALDKLNASLTAYQEIVEKSKLKIEENKNFLNIYTGVDYDNIFNSKNKLIENIYKGISEVKNYLIQNNNYQKNIQQYQKLVDQYNSLIIQYNNKIEEYDKEIEDIVKQKIELNRQFYLKYSRFIQEGTWTSEDYIDDDLYYLDAESVLYTSSRPQIQYNINVLELSQLEGYEKYNFSIGDKTFIEDTEFFGYIVKNGLITPYQESIIVSELSLYLDSSEKNNIKVQNYKTQFEDLFQRITASVQSLEYKSGAYERAADAITSNGEIEADLLQNSITNNNLIIQNALNQSVIWDNTGITITDLQHTNELLRIVSGGVLLSNDGGINWKVGITGSGINTDFLTAGQIDASKINIRSGSFASFRWDTYGINAFEFSIDENTGNPYNFNFNNFTRFDQYGIYGVRGEENNDNSKDASYFKPNSIKEIRDAADFGLTWDGFFLKNKYNNHIVEISNINDFVINRIIKNNEESLETTLVKIGKLDENSFGLQLNNTLGNPTLRASNGQLWLSDSLFIAPTEFKEEDVRAQFGIVNSEYQQVLVETAEEFENNKSKYYYLDENNNYVQCDDTSVYNADTNYYREVSKILSIRDLNEIETIWVKDDGTASFKGVTIEGDIHATSGYIGNISITESGGLILNEGSDILVRSYLQSDVTQEEFESNQTNYFYLDENNNYIQCDNDSAYDVNKTYYVYDTVFYLNGTTGELESYKGHFYGEIQAENGSINGLLSIGNELIIDGENSLIYSSNYQENSNKGFLFSSDGSISANQLILGAGAKIKDYIQFGTNGNNSSFIYNPDNHNNLFINSIVNGESTLNIYKNGNVDFGLIKVDSSKSTITAYQDETNKYWELGPDYSIFNNILARGTINAAKIQTAIFEKQKTQVSGGYTLYKPSAFLKEIRGIDGSTIVTDPKVSDIFSENDYIIFKSNTGNYSKIYQIVRIIIGEKEYAVLNESVIEEIDISDTLVINLQQTDDWIIGINATSSPLQLGTDSLQLTQNSISMSTYSIDENNNLNGNLVLVLGALDSSLTGITDGDKNKIIPGLYTNSAFLKGSLTTEFREEIGEKYAGINTIHKALFNRGIIGLEEDNSTIVFWAGAAGKAIEDIQKSPFQVTSKGTVYAKQGYFEGSILTKATIEASEIKTALITGIGEEFALTIKDTNNAIRFVSENNGLYTDKFIMKQDIAKFNLDIDIGEIISLSTNGEINAKEFISGISSLNNGLIFSNIEIINNIDGTSTINRQEVAKIFWDKNTSTIQVLNNNIVVNEISQNETKINNNLYISENIKYDEIMEDKKIEENGVLIGYDLYIYEI